MITVVVMYIEYCRSRTEVVIVSKKKWLLSNHFCFSEVHYWIIQLTYLLWRPCLMLWLTNSIEQRVVVCAVNWMNWRWMWLCYNCVCAFDTLKRIWWWTDQERFKICQDFESPMTFHALLIILWAGSGYTYKTWYIG